mmetsp:Transcript_27539/g.70140  ORF Transcript_27539/g.70140 Transcript_27539/m.70140 type:complete len:192 (-) Transcript_27539:252-827(-)
MQGSCWWLSSRAGAAAGWPAESPVHGPTVHCFRRIRALQMDQKAPRATCASLGPRPPPNSSHSRCMPPAVPRLPPVATSLPALARVLTAAPFLHLHLHPCGSHACLAAATPMMVPPIVPIRAASLLPASADPPPIVIGALAAESPRSSLSSKSQSSTLCIAISKLVRPAVRGGRELMPDPATYLLIAAPPP